jgi:hypothetical protein
MLIERVMRVSYEERITFLRIWHRLTKDIMVVLRACADGRNIKWGFWPPSRHDNPVNDQNGDGLLISSDPGGPEGWEDDESGDDVDEEGQELFSNDDDASDEARDEVDTETDAGTESDPAIFAGGRFRALSLLDNGDMDDSS